MRFVNYTLLAVISFLFLASCDKKNVDEIREEASKVFPYRKDKWFTNKDDLIDPYRGLSREDYREVIAPEKLSMKPLSENKIIEPSQLTDLLEEPEENNVIRDKLVSISVNEDIPLKEVLVELARKAEIDVEIDKDIDGSIIFIAKERPFTEVIKRIANMAALRYEIEDGVLKIERDQPLIQTYIFNILDITRNSESNVTTSFSVGSEGGEGGATASITSGSSSSLDTKSGDGDVWSDVEAAVTAIIANYENDGGENDAVSQILSVNKSSGIISVLANQRQHREIKEVLDTLHMSITSQVLIEAKVLEVTLDDEYSSGINWSVLADNVFSTSKFGTAASDILSGTVSTSSLAAANANIVTPTGDSDLFKFSVLPTNIFGNDNTSLEASVELLETFGVTRSLSNPRISAMNNQYAVLNFTENDVYFEVTLEEEEKDTGAGQDNNITVDSEIRTIPIGVVLALQPSIDLKRKEITMSIRPTLTRSNSSVSDPGVSIIAQRLNINTDGLNSDIPVVEVREIDTVLRVQDGEIIMIGGLLEERANNIDSGIPGISKIPYVGNAFKKVTKDTAMVETVIFLKARIIPGRGVTVEDEEFYKKFTSGRHKFFVD
jgi:MSHA type pilus biogenesis protein MshL